MTKKGNAKAVAFVKPDPKVLQLINNPDETLDQTVGRVASDPAVSAGSVMQSYGNHLGSEVNLMSMIGAIQSTTQRVKAGDLSDLEAMLVSQATALQTIFTNLARRAQDQQYQRNLEAFLGLALKAQAQSRSTITALVDLKFPRQVAFVKQANINSGSGNQQVNNGLPADTERSARAHEEKQISEIKELEVGDGQWLDTGTKSSAVGADPNLAPVGKGDRADKPRRKSKGGP